MEAVFLIRRWFNTTVMLIRKAEAKPNGKANQESCSRAVWPIAVWIGKFLKTPPAKRVAELDGLNHSAMIKTCSDGLNHSTG